MFYQGRVRGKTTTKKNRTISVRGRCRTCRLGQARIADSGLAFDDKAGGTLRTEFDTTQRCTRSHIRQDLRPALIPIPGCRSPPERESTHLISRLSLAGMCALGGGRGLREIAGSDYILLPPPFFFATACI